MADDATISLTATILPDEIAKTISGSMIVTGSLEVKSVNATDDFFLLKSGSMDSVKVNGEGVLQLGEFLFTPTALRGAIYYNRTEDEFFVGKNN